MLAIEVTDQVLSLVGDNEPHVAAAIYGLIAYQLAQWGAIGLEFIPAKIRSGRTLKDLTVSENAIELDPFVELFIAGEGGCYGRCFISTTE